MTTPPVPPSGEAASAGSNALEEAMLDRVRQLGLETDPEFMVELIDSYAPLFENQFRAIQEGCANQESGKVHHAAHSLKGASLNIGANELAARCRTIEDLAEQKDVVAAQQLLPLLKDDLTKTLISLASIKAKLSGRTPTS